MNVFEQTDTVYTLSNFRIARNHIYTNNGLKHS